MKNKKADQKNFIIESKKNIIESGAKQQEGENLRFEFESKIFGKLYISIHEDLDILYSFYMRFEDIDISIFFNHFSKYEQINTHSYKWNYHGPDKATVLNELKQRLNNLMYIDNN